LEAPNSVRRLASQRHGRGPRETDVRGRTEVVGHCDA
jgi:hypothetical protein